MVVDGWVQLTRLRTVFKTHKQSIHCWQRNLSASPESGRWRWPFHNVMMAVSTLCGHVDRLLVFVCYAFSVVSGLTYILARCPTLSIIQQPTKQAQCLCKIIPNSGVIHLVNKQTVALTRVICFNLTQIGSFQYCL